MSRRYWKLYSFTLLLASFALACSGTTDDDDGPGPGECPATLPLAAQRCDVASCNATTGTKTFSLADLAAADAGRWLIVSRVTSDLFENEVVNVQYEKSVAGALTARLLREKRRAELSPEHRELLFGEARQARITAEQLIRENAKDAVPARGPVKSGIVGRSLLPPGAHAQVVGEPCAAAAPFCTGDLLCVAAPGGGARTCQSAVQIKWRDQNDITMYETVDATVRRVGRYAAIVTDDNDNVADAAVEELLKRFDERIAPYDHAFFGEPKNTSTGKDFDDNGVVILFLTTRVADIDPDLAGFFQAIDLEDPAVNDASNGADILYMQPPGANVSMGSLSGTLAHEYQHVINYFAKVINNQSQQEARWLDEGLSVFAEDVTGYGSDAFKNVAAYLASVGDTSLTGFGLIHTNENEADSIERRGMAALFVRYVYEQKGAATFGPAADAVSDGGGVAAIRSLVQSANTGVELFTAASTGRSLDGWLKGYFTAVAIDDAGYEDVSCNVAATFQEPEMDSYTGYQRGIALRTSVPDAEGGTIPLNGPNMNTFEGEEVPVPANGGEIRTLTTASGVTTVGIGGPAEDYVLGFEAIPIGE